MNATEFKSLILSLDENSKYDQYALGILANWNGKSIITYNSMQNCSPDDITEILWDLNIKHRCGASASGEFYISIIL